MWHAKVYVQYKDGILEPQGMAVKEALHSLSFNDIAHVAIGKFIDIQIDNCESKQEAENTIKKICEKLLVNQVMEKYSFELIEEQ